MDILERCRPIHTPSLFTVGEKSAFKTECEALMAYFDAPEAVYHAGGHIVPTDEDSLERIAAFLLTQCNQAGRGNETVMEKSTA